MNDGQQTNAETALTRLQNHSARLKELYQKIKEDSDIYTKIKSEEDYTNWKPLKREEYNEYIYLREDNLRIRDAAMEQKTTGILEAANIDLTTNYDLPAHLTHKYGQSIRSIGLVTNADGSVDRGEGLLRFYTMVKTKPLHDAVQKNQFGEAGSYNSKENAQKALNYAMDSLGNLKKAASTDGTITFTVKDEMYKSTVVDVYDETQTIQLTQSNSTDTKSIDNAKKELDVLINKVLPMVGLKGEIGKNGVSITITENQIRANNDARGVVSGNNVILNTKATNPTPYKQWGFINHEIVAHLINQIHFHDMPLAEFNGVQIPYITPNATAGASITSYSLREEENIRDARISHMITYGVWDKMSPIEQKAYAELFIHIGPVDIVRMQHSAHDAYGTNASFTDADGVKHNITPLINYIERPSDLFVSKKEMCSATKFPLSSNELRFKLGECKDPLTIGTIAGGGLLATLSAALGIIYCKKNKKACFKNEQQPNNENIEMGENGQPVDPNDVIIDERSLDEEKQAAALPKSESSIVCFNNLNNEPGSISYVKPNDHKSQASPRQHHNGPTLAMSMR